MPCNLSTGWCLALACVVAIGGTCSTLVSIMQWLKVRGKSDRSLKRFLRPLLRMMTVLYWGWLIKVLECWNVIPFSAPAQFVSLLLTDFITISLPIALVLISLHFLSALSPDGSFDYLPLCVWACLNMGGVLTLDILTVVRNVAWYHGVVLYWVLVAMWVAVFTSWRKVYVLLPMFRLRDEAAFVPGELVLRRYLYFLVAVTLAVSVATVPWVWFGYDLVQDRKSGFNYECVDSGNVIFAALQVICLLGVSVWLAPHSDELWELVPP